MFRQLIFNHAQSFRAGQQIEKALGIGGFGVMNDYRDHITIDPGKRGGKPCIRSMRITVYDVLDWLAPGLSESQILEDYPELTQDDIRACLAFTANR